MKLRRVWYQISNRNNYFWSNTKKQWVKFDGLNELDKSYFPIGTDRFFYDVKKARDHFNTLPANSGFHLKKISRKGDTFFLKTIEK